MMRIILCCATVLAALAVSTAQDDRVEVRGRVVNAHTGETIAGATVTPGGLERAVRTDAARRFLPRWPSLMPEIETWRKGTGRRSVCGGPAS